MLIIGFIFCVLFSLFMTVVTYQFSVAWYLTRLFSGRNCQESKKLLWFDIFVGIITVVSWYFTIINAPFTISFNA